MSFRKLGLHEKIVEAIEKTGITTPTKIQELSIPEIIKGKDIIAGSATGSGKTLAFGTGLIHNLGNAKKLESLVLAPTREIAQQVKDVLHKITKLKIITIYGGVSINPQIDALRTANIVVGTPGRILDHMQRGTINLKQIKVLVLDEADKMFEMGFIEDVERIINACPKHRQTLLFSATFSPQVEKICKNYMHDPQRVQGVKQVDPTKLRQVYYNCPVNVKFSVLAHFIKEEKGIALVFCNTKRMVDVLVKSIRKVGLAVNGIHGDMSQAKRNAALQEFKDKKVDILVCTDVAARGLDIPDVSHVYNYDIPIDPKDYVHRIGRTARAGKEGEVRNILAGPDYDAFARIQRDYDGINIERKEMPEVERVNMERVERKPFRGGPRRGGFRSGPRRSFGRSSQGSRSGGRSQGNRSGPRRSFNRRSSR